MAKNLWLFVVAVAITIMVGNLVVRKKVTLPSNALTLTHSQETNLETVTALALKLKALRPGSEMRLIPNFEHKFLNVNVKFTSIETGRRFEMVWYIPEQGPFTGATVAIGGYSKKRIDCDPFVLRGRNACR